MKMYYRLLFLFVCVIGFSSCEDNLDDDNIPAIQAVRNGEFFKSTEMTAVSNADGSVSIIGQNRLERLELKLESGTAGTYPLGSGAPNEAIYTFNNTDVFSTNEGAGTGQVVLSSSTPPGTLTGTFSFVSYLPQNADSLYMRKGIIYQVPFGTTLPGGGGGGGTNAFTASVDGTVFTPTSITPVAANNFIVVNASNGSGSIVLTFPESITVGSYTFGGASTVIGSYVVGSSVNPAVSGTLDITAVDPAAQSVTGTFNFMTGPPDNFNITNGAFTIFY